MLISTVSKILRPAGATVGALMVVGGYILTGKEIVSLGLPIWAWQSIGAGIFCISLIAIVYSYQRKLDALSANISDDNVGGLPNISFIGKYKKGKKIGKPESLIFPYIWRIDASQLQQGKNYLSLNYCLPNALSFDLTFIKARCHLVINLNNTTEEKEMRPVVIKKQQINEGYIEINLGEKISQQTRDNFKNKVAMRFKLHIFCWDNENNEHPLMTQDYETIALV